MKYTLYYKNIGMGTVVEDDFDFPNLFGFYELSRTFQSIETNDFLINYINYSIAADKLMYENEDEWLKFIEQEEKSFNDLIESEDWKLAHEEGEIHKILIPNFCDKNKIVWRWNS
ncbi:MAG: hypothetical protein AB8B69_03675 [Chitinophagales bacterium]